MHTFSNADKHSNDEGPGVVLQSVVHTVMDMMCHVELISCTCQQPHWSKLAQLVDNVKWRVVDDVPMCNSDEQISNPNLS